MSLPEDHMITLGWLYDIIDVDKICSEFVESIISSTNSYRANKNILNLLIPTTENDYQLLGLSFLIERLATGDVLMSDCPNIESFRNG